MSIVISRVSKESDIDFANRILIRAGSGENIAPHQVAAARSIKQAADTAAAHKASRFNSKVF